uniref:PiggyBac transposable element-derived protein domain-containing protein n=1 Tax=Bactrocera latifrons TaxID=174628 RepID=A0A0K8W961_BACLA
MFTRDKFNQVFWILHLNTIHRQDAGLRTCFQLVRCFLDYIILKLFNYFTLGREICVDESTIKFKGLLHYLQSEETDQMRNSSLYYNRLNHRLYLWYSYLFWKFDNRLLD